MKVYYLGPLVIGIKHLALDDVDCDSYSPNCFAVEVGPDAGVHGAVVELDDALHLYRVFRVGPRFRLLQPSGGNGLMATARMVRGVVVHQARCKLDEMA